MTKDAQTTRQLVVPDDGLLSYFIDCWTSLRRMLFISCSNQAQKTESRFKFMKKLAEKLTRPHMERREKNDFIQRDIKTSIRRVLQIREDLPVISDEEKLQVRKACFTCDPKKKRKTAYLCFMCKVPICLECSKKMCCHCREKM